MQPELSAAGGALKLGFFVSGLTVACLSAHLATADVNPYVRAHVEAKALTQRVNGKLTDEALRQLVDAEKDPLFDRFDPAVRHQAETAAVHGFEGPAPLLHLFQLAPGTAQAMNAQVAFSLDPNPPARPFVLTGSAAHRANAITCMTQAVYYEAGFEPANGQQAVAQVVLNRMRHPVYPHSVCGVVYQGSELKTGCQFSFTCDGSMARKPQQAAWDRSKAVAEQALNGFVMKAVGGATNYHTQWVVPWWQPTVSKVAQVGAHIFYRWQGALGLPAAFTMRYAGNERIMAAPNMPGVIEPDGVAPKDVDGRVHTVIQMADATLATPQTPRERMAALAAQGKLGAGFDPASAQATESSAGQPAKSEPVTLAAAVELQVPKLDVTLTPAHVDPPRRPHMANMNCMSANCSHW